MYVLGLYEHFWSFKASAASFFSASCFTCSEDLSSDNALVGSCPNSYFCIRRLLFIRCVQGEAENIAFSASLSLLLEYTGDAVVWPKGDRHTKAHWGCVGAQQNTKLMLCILDGYHLGASYSLWTIGSARERSIPVLWNPYFIHTVSLDYSNQKVFPLVLLFCTA